jgi:hypothetical protein
MNDFPNGSPRPGAEDERVRALLDEAVSDVEPREALDSIHARTRATSARRKRSWLLGAGGAMVATAATVAAVTALAPDSTPDSPDAPGPAASTSITPPERTSPEATARPTGSPPAPSTTQTVPVYYVGETSRGPRLFREFHRVHTGGDPLRAAVREAVTVPPADPDYRSDWPTGTAVNTSFDGSGNTGQISIGLYNEGTDLRRRPAGMSAEDAAMAVQQLVYTAQAATQTRAPVQFYLTRRGSSKDRTDTILGVPVSEPLAQGDPADVLAQVWVIDPAEGAAVRAPFTVSGVAAAFEANVQWELRQGDRVVKEGFTTAKECCTMAPYAFEVDVPPGEYTLVVHDSDPSGGEGLAPWQDTKQLTVVP